MGRGESPQEQHKLRMAKLQEKTQQKVTYHLSKPYIEVTHFYHIIREFFLELLEKEYEPTYEEILDELESIEHDHLDFSPEQRGRARSLLEALSEIEYSGQEPGQEQLKRILQGFHDLAVEFTTYEEEGVDHFLKRGFLALKKGDKELAKKFYTQAHGRFEKLGEESRKRYVSELRELYTRVAN